MNNNKINKQTMYTLPINEPYFIYRFNMSEDTIKVKVSVDYDRQRSVEYQKLCQQAVRPLDEACQRCTKIKFLVTDGVLTPICHETCDIYKEIQKTLDLIKKQFDYE